MLRVYIEKINPKKIEKEVKRFLSCIDYQPSKKKIFIKPNICGLYKSNSPCIVNPRIVGGLIEYCKDLGYKEIIIAESPVSRDVEKVFKISGYTQLEQRYKIKLLNLVNVERISVDLGRIRVNLPRFLFEDYEYINVAKMKTHIQTKVTLCTKNQKGLIDLGDRKKMHISGDLQENIKILAQKIKPDFCVIDALNPLEGNGPGRTGKEVKNMNTLVAGRSMEAVDWIATKLMGIDPMEVRHLIKPKEDIEIVGPVKKRNFLLPSDHFQKFNIHFWITDKTCSGCTDIMGEFKKELLRHPNYLVKFLYLALWRRLDILTGGVNPPKTKGKIICFGNCMQEKAKMYNLPLVKGCPPSVKDLIEMLRR